MDVCHNVGLAVERWINLMHAIMWCYVVNACTLLHEYTVDSSHSCATLQNQYTRRKFFQLIFVSLFQNVSLLYAMFNSFDLSYAAEMFGIGK